MQSMNLTKLSAAIILALSTAACSSGGSHSTTSTSPVITEQTAAEKAAAEKAAAEKAAAEKAAAEKAAAEKAAAEKAAAEKAAAEKAAAEKAEAERLAKIEANRVALVAKAKAAGLTDAQATAYAAANKEATAAAAQKALDNLVADNAKKALEAEVLQAKGEASKAYPIGEIASNVTSSSDVTIFQQGYNRRELKLSYEVVYNQPYSIILGNYYNSVIANLADFVLSSDVSSDISIKGLKTNAQDIPSLGKATYNGKAFISDQNQLINHAHSIVNKTFLSFIFNGLFSC